MLLLTTQGYLQPRDVPPVGLGGESLLPESEKHMHTAPYYSSALPPVSPETPNRRVLAWTCAVLCSFDIMGRPSVLVWAGRSVA